jgi:hypothetical protein
LSFAARCAAALALLAVAFAVSGCGETVIDGVKVEDTIQGSLEKTLHEKIKTVDCPSEPKVDPGTTFDCQVERADGKQETVTLKIRNKDADLSIVGLQPTK